MKNIFYFLLLLGVSAFAQKEKFVYTYENPKVLQEFLDDNKVNYDVKDLAVLDHVADWLDFYKKKKLSVPTAYFFDSAGVRIVEDFDATICSEVINGLESIEKVKSYKKDPNENINSWLSQIDFRFTKDEIFTETYDIYVIVIYGKLIKTKTSNPTAFNWYNSLKKNSNLKIKTILLSIDIMDDWELPQDFKTEFGLK